MGAVDQDDVLQTRPPEPSDRGVPAPLSDRVRSLQLPRHSPGEGGSGARWIPWLACLILAGTTAAFGFLAFGRPAAREGMQPTPAGVDAPQDPTGDTQLAMEGDVVLQSKGYVIPKHQILVAPKVAGRIIELRFEEGQFVEKDKTLLARLEPDEYKADHDRAEAALAAARHRFEEIDKNRADEIAQVNAELQEAEAQYVLAERDWGRSEALYGKNAISVQDFESSRTQYQAARHRKERLEFAMKIIDVSREQRRRTAEAEVKQAAAELAKAKWRLDNCEIYAPISGTILKKNAEQWSVVNPIAAQGLFSLCEMADLSELEVEVSVMERDVSRIFKDQRCRVYAEAYPPEKFPDRVYEGKVSRLMPIADRAKGAIPVRVEFRVPVREQGLYLKPQMGAIVTFFKDKAPENGSQAKDSPKDRKGS
jgi:HlyD family secretion protein